MQDLEDYFRQAGIVMPLVNNDGFDYGNFAPGTGVGQVDIYGHDSYPLGFDCSQPYNWTGDYFPTDFHTEHEIESPTSPYLINEVSSFMSKRNDVDANVYSSREVHSILGEGME